MNEQGLAPATCPRCAGSFGCGAQASAPCPCTSVALSAAQTAELRRLFTGCLCLNCLRAVAAGEAADKPAAGAAR